MLKGQKGPHPHRKTGTETITAVLTISPNLLLQCLELLGQMNALRQSRCPNQSNGRLTQAKRFCVTCLLKNLRKSAEEVGNSEATLVMKVTCLWIPSFRSLASTAHNSASIQIELEGMVVARVWVIVLLQELLAQR